MRRRLATISLMAMAAGLVPCTRLHAQSAPVPSDRRIAARVERYLTAPDNLPMHMPTDVAIDTAGRVYVADGANDRLLRFNSEGIVETIVTQVGSERLNRPVGIAAGPQDRLWIADTGSHRILVMDPAGVLIEQIEPPAEQGEHEFDPTDLVVTADGRRTYIVDNNNHRVFIRNNETKAFGPSMGGRGEGLGRFQWPFMICIAADEYIYVSEAVGARLQRISPQDRWAGQVGRWGVELGALYRPKGVAADTAERLFVSDSTLQVVQVFGLRGNVLGVLTTDTGQPLRFAHPMGMCFDAQGRLYVVELKANRVAVVVLGQAAHAAPQGAPSREGPR